MKTINLFDPEENGNNLCLPESVGRGVIQSIIIKKGIYLFLADCCLDEPVALRYFSEKKHPGILGIQLRFSGEDVPSHNCLKMSFNPEAGESMLFFFPSEKELCEKIDSPRVLSLTIMISADFLNDPKVMFRKNPALLFSKTNQKCDKVSDPIKNLLNQILACPFKGVSRRFFIEGKVMEILAHLVNSGIGQYPLDEKDPLKPQEVEIVEKAAEIMKYSPGNYSNLDAISRSVGMCRSRFHKCFCEVYGVSPFEYHRKLRMEAAKTLLVKGRMNITEVAYSVGYSSLSHFAKIFKEHEGLPPSEYKKNFEKPLINDAIM